MAAFLRVLPKRWRRGSFAYKMAAFLIVLILPVSLCNFTVSNDFLGVCKCRMSALSNIQRVSLYLAFLVLLHCLFVWNKVKLVTVPVRDTHVIVLMWRVLHFKDKSARRMGHRPIMQSSILYVTSPNVHWFKNSLTSKLSAKFAMKQPVKTKQMLSYITLWFKKTLNHNAYIRLQPVFWHSYFTR